MLIIFILLTFIYLIFLTLSRNAYIGFFSSIVLIFGLKSLLVAIGSCELFLKTTKFRDWDIMPASLFLEEINYKMLYLDSNSFNFGSQIEFNRGLLFYNPYKIDKKMINYIKNLGKNFDI